MVLGPNDEALLRTLMQNEHNTCLRFASASFNIKEVSRVCTHQLVRLAHCGLLQRSQRYCNDDGMGFYVPAELEDDKYSSFFERSMELYKEAIQEGIPEEMARYLLPGAVMSEINMTANFQTWKHFLGIRLAKKVQLETRQVAAEVCRQLYKIAPIVFEKDEHLRVEMATYGEL